MKTFTRLLFFIICCCSTSYLLNAQNLVLNPSFEQTTACPQGISQFSLAVNWGQGNSGPDSCTTSDLYADCVPQIGGANSPNGLLGKQASRTGTHHAGIILAETLPFGGCSALGDNYREYIQGTLSSPLVAGQKYVVKFYVSLPDEVAGGTDDIGVYFSNTAYSHNACNGNQLMPVTPQLNYCGPPIVDTTNWVEIKWIYTATGGEQYLTIGNFKNDANTTVAPHRCSGGGGIPFTQNPYVYFYIDDVEVSAAGPNDCAFSLATTTENAGCANNNGKAKVITAGCSSPFTYLWSTNGNRDSITGIASGTYTVTVTDNTSCSSTISVAVDKFNAPAATITTINSSCGANTGTAIANVNATSNPGPYTYQWSGGGGTGQVASNLAPGSYTVTVTGAGNCSATAAGTIATSNGNLQLTTASTPANCGASNGTASVTTNGTGPFTYLWNNQATTASISNLAPGTYTVTVTGGSTQATPFYTEDFTSGGTGWTLNTAGPGTNGPGYNRWIINNVTDCGCGTGNYLHVTCDPTGFFCLGSGGDCTYSPGSPFPNPLITDPTADRFSSSPDINTTGKSNMVLKFKYKVGGDPNNDYGTLRFSNDGGTTWTDMPTKYVDSAFNCANAVVSIPNLYENITNFRIAFRWINNGDGTGDDPGFSIDDIEISEGGGSACPSVASVVVSGGSGLSLTSASTDAICGQNNGTATATVSGSGNFTYSWSNGGSSATINNLAAGTYTVTVTGGGNCSATASTTVVGTAGINLTQASTNATCGNNNGTATVTPSGAGNFTYTWSNGGSTSTISNLAPGVYNVTVSQSGCSATASAIVSPSAGLEAAFTVTQPSCGQANGALDVTSITGGTQPITVEWKLNGSVISTSNQITNLGGGTYTFHAVDANNCSVDSTFTLLPGGTTNVSIQAPPTLCSGDSGEICAPAGYAAYQWNSGEVTQCIFAKFAGNYAVTVTDNGNCTAASNRVAVNFYPLPAVSITVNGDTLTAFNATSYQWYLNGNEIAGATSATYIATQSGNYTVRIGNANGCFATSNPVSVVVSGVGSLAAEGVRIYPNPTPDGWYLDVTSNLVGKMFEVFDDAGKLVYRANITHSKMLINFNAAQGVYMIKLNTGSKILTQKLIKL